MIKLKEMINQNVDENSFMWTYKEAKPYAEMIDGKIVGSVKTKGKSNHDLDILVPNHSKDISNILEKNGFTYMGSQVVSPKEIKKSRKFGGRSEFWLRNKRYVNLINYKAIEVWWIIENNYIS